jgi:hypothetical protein
VSRKQALGAWFESLSHPYKRGQPARPRRLRLLMRVFLAQAGGPSARHRQVEATMSSPHERVVWPPGEHAYLNDVFPA